ncbi:MAG: hypothetical protein M9896_19255 [Candidatus Promineofilum sp.]|uniref:hypothetical protein n=1 Tax=Promineifilum sp. TaxID=2664178 RepID=UPI002411ABCD|nr:hypothetical protein [Promineifilum sp.]
MNEITIKPPSSDKPGHLRRFKRLADVQARFNSGDIDAVDDAVDIILSECDVVVPGMSWLSLWLLVVKRITSNERNHHQAPADDKPGYLRRFKRLADTNRFNSGDLDAVADVLISSLMSAM